MTGVHASQNLMGQFMQDSFKQKYAEDFHTQVLNTKYAQEYARKALLQIARDIKKDGLEDAYQKVQQHLAASGPLERQ